MFELVYLFLSGNCSEDLNQNCKVDMMNLALFADGWLKRTLPECD